MVTRTKRNLRGAPSPKQHRRQQLDGNEQQAPPLPPPKKDKQHNSPKNTPSEHHLKNPPSIDPTSDQSLEQHAALVAAEDEDEEDTDGRRLGSNGPTPQQASQLPTKITLKLTPPPSVNSDTSTRIRSRPKKGGVQIPLSITPQLTPLHSPSPSISSSDDEIVSRPTHLTTKRSPRQVFSHNTESDTDFDIDMSEAIWGNPFSSQKSVMITWTDNEEDENKLSADELEELKLDMQENDLEELLAWGSGEMRLAGMPEFNNDDSDIFWPRSGPFVELELDASDSDTEADLEDGEAHESSIDSAEEEEQMLALHGLCAFGSDTEGDTTDSIDDTDHDGLIRFGIEQADEPTPAIRRRPKTAKGKPKSTTTMPPKADGPTLGSFKAASTAKEIAVVAENASALPVDSPFSVKKIRYLKAKTQAASDAPSRRRTNSLVSSHSTGSMPSTIIEQPSPLGTETLADFADIPEEGDDEAEVYMDLDLDDLIEANAMHAEFDVELVDSDDPDALVTDQVDGSMSDLSRWNRIPIGAYRKSRSPYKAAQNAFAPAMRRGSLDPTSDAAYFQIANLLSSRETITVRVPWQLGQKRKITRQELIGLSPMLCPVRAPPSGVKSRKQKRADRKAVKKSHFASPDKSSLGLQPHASSIVDPASPGTTIPDSEVPLLALPGASTALPETISTVASSPMDLLPAATLPSAECLPLHSPLFSAIKISPVRAQF